MKNKVAAVYARVSTDSQSTEAQEVELEAFVSRRGWSCRVYRDTGQSGIKESRPALDRLLRDCRARKVDVVVVWAMDRLARSLRHLLDTVEEFHSLGIDFVSYKQQIDTSTPSGRLAYQILGAVAEFEREMLRERVKAGIQSAKRRGRRIGRPALRRFTPEEKQEVKVAHAQGASVRRLAIDLGTTQWMISQIIAGQGEGSRKLNLSGAKKRA